MLFIISIMMFAATYLVMLAVLMNTATARATTRMQATHSAVSALMGPGLDRELSKSLGKRLVFPKLGRLCGKILGLTPRTYLKNARTRLDRAGYFGSNAIASYLAAKAACLAGGLAATFLTMALFPGSLPIKLAAGLCALVVGLALPEQTA